MAQTTNLAKKVLTYVMALGSAVSILAIHSGLARAGEPHQDPDKLYLSDVFNLPVDNPLRRQAQETCSTGAMANMVLTLTGLTVNDGVVEETSFYTVEAWHGYQNELLVIGMIYRSKVKDKVCLIEWGYPTFPVESIFQEQKSQDTKSLIDSHCSQSRRDLKLLEEDEKLYRSLHIIDLEGDPNYNPEFFVFYVFQRDHHESGFTEFQQNMAIEIYVEMNIPNNYWFCKVGFGYRSMLADAYVEGFGWITDWATVFKDPTQYHR